jgi:hypothetical protein
MTPFMSLFRYTNLCMVEPAAFTFNAETAVTNRFQQPGADAPAAVAQRARCEFAELVQQLRAAGINVCVARDTPEPAKPDAVFPNNWVSFHDDGTVVLYPLLNPSRRAERREAVIDSVKQQLGFRELRRLDMTGEEQRGRYLEGTGSLVLDHTQRIAYACRSPRTDESLVREWTRAMRYEAVVFDATTTDGTPVYHTNVLLWIGANIAGVGLEWVASAQRDDLRERLTQNGRQALQLTNAQLHDFAGNMLEVLAPSGARRLVMSARAAQSLSAEQRAQIAAAGCVPLISAVPTIEQLGGGSVRCMLAEVPAQSGVAN